MINYEHRIFPIKCLLYGVAKPSKAILFKKASVIPYKLELNTHNTEIHVHTKTLFNWINIMHV